MKLEKQNGPRNLKFLATPPHNVFFGYSRNTVKKSKDLIDKKRKLVDKYHMKIHR